MSKAFPGENCPGARSSYAGAFQERDAPVAAARCWCLATVMKSCHAAAEPPGPSIADLPPTALLVALSWSGSRVVLVPLTHQLEVRGEDVSAPNETQPTVIYWARASTSTQSKLSTHCSLYESESHIPPCMCLPFCLAGSYEPPRSPHTHPTHK